MAYDKEEGKLKTIKLYTNTIMTALKIYPKHEADKDLASTQRSVDCVLRQVLCLRVSWERNSTKLQLCCKKQVSIKRPAIYQIVRYSMLQLEDYRMAVR